jgi:hypothetical protein
MTTDEHGHDTIPLFDLPAPEQLQPAQTMREAVSRATPQWRSYSGRRVACDECITYLHEHDGRGPQPRSARRVRILGKDQWRLCPAHAEPREAADKAAKEAADKRMAGRRAAS